MSEQAGNPAARAAHRVLLIAYEFPPVAGGGAARVLKYAKYLRREGWEPIVLTAEPGYGRPLDPALLSEVDGVEIARLPARNLIWTLARLAAPLRAVLRGLKKPDGSGGSSSVGAERVTRAPRSPLTTRIARWLTFPDEASPWARAVERVAPALCERRAVEVVLASGPPFSALAAAIAVGGKTGLPVVLDMRDQWRDNVGFTWPTASRARRAEALEARVLGAASAVVCATDGIAAEARAMGARLVETLYNGFDPESIPPREAVATGPLRIAFLGRFSRDVMDPTAFFRGLAAAMTRDAAVASVHVDIVGPAAPWVGTLVEGLGIGGAVTYHGFRPYDEAMRIVAAADVGLMCVADRPGSAELYPGKLFDYLGLGLPVLFVGPSDGGVARLVAEGGFGVAVRQGDVDGIAGAVIALAHAKETGTALATPDPEVAARFDRRVQVGRLARLLERVSGVLG